MSECTSCGAEIDYRDKFCGSCGTLTTAGRPPAEQIGKALADAVAELTKLLEQFVTYVRDERNRKQVIIGGSALALFLVVLIDNPISNGISSLFDGEKAVPQLTADGLPDFASYEDVFLGEETEFVTTGTANVRDFPTSQGTSVIRTLQSGHAISARQVHAFDPSSQWYKLSDGGYVWGGNLRSSEQAQDEAAVTFPASLRGQWADRNSCDGLGDDSVITVSGNEIDFGTTRYGLVNILAAGEEIPVYELNSIGRETLPNSKVYFSQDARWKVVWIQNGDPVEGDRFRYFRAGLPCLEVLSIAEQMSR